MLNDLISELKKFENKEKAKTLKKFFKTNAGEYGEGDIFLGISVPQQREIAKKYSGMSLPKIQKLLDSKIHEHRLIALLILMNKFKKADERTQGDIFNFYVKNSEKINNWDLVDISSPHIVGKFLFNKKKDILYEFAQSNNLWKKRISVVSCCYFIKQEEYNDALRIFEILLRDEHDLIHKAIGWMLREIGKRDEKVLLKFLKKHYKNLPRTTLRYAIEKFKQEKRKELLKEVF